jgi:hypothetical protein
MSTLTPTSTTSSKSSSSTCENESSSSSNSSSPPPSSPEDVTSTAAPLSLSDDATTLISGAAVAATPAAPPTAAAAAAAAAPRRASNLSLRRSSISAAPLNFGTKTGFKGGGGGGGPSVAIAEACCCSCCSTRGGDLDITEALAVAGVLAALVPTGSRSLFSWSCTLLAVAIDPACDRFETWCLRRPLTPMPNAPVRDGPKIVDEYLSPVAPGKPDMLRGLAFPLPPPPEEVGPPSPPLPLPPSELSGEIGGLGIMPSSGHFVESAREAAVM